MGQVETVMKLNEAGYLITSFFIELDMDCLASTRHQVNNPLLKWRRASRFSYLEVTMHQN